LDWTPNIQYQNSAWSWRDPFTFGLTPTEQQERADLEEEYNRNRRVRTIPPNEMFQLMVTDVYPPSSLRPATESVYYESRTVNGSRIESQYFGVEVFNKDFATINASAAEVLPSYMEKAEYANYTISFIPTNFEQNMKIRIRVPYSLIVSEPVECIGIAGTSQQTIECYYDYVDSYLVMPDALVSTEVMPL
jgi:hypothetical protein